MTTTQTTTERRCYCAGDCNCRSTYRLPSCGCECQNTAKVFRNGEWVKR